MKKDDKLITKKISDQEFYLFGFDDEFEYTVTDVQGDVITLNRKAILPAIHPDIITLYVISAEKNISNNLHLNFIFLNHCEAIFDTKSDVTEFQKILEVYTPNSKYDLFELKAKLIGVAPNSKIRRHWLSAEPTFYNEIEKGDIVRANRNSHEIWYQILEK